ncbi:3-oxoacyl-ACP reductase [Saccharomonospora piscinae]|uniref:3-oxoacyl-ACP reductase n=1 Tax=Saccharomonospora piscinae TaxID=687388 RepID=A0A1V9A4F9_SACPI|nr:SDR family oxidoreductase [Saccharomonospora piscinae]OQO92017.1 3-oxoacyl-ACP reductase [Saccharomonospora piscinae]TLW92306.1 SDR family oxidoreductase [Saccharomonospora piscinae]
MPHGERLAGQVAVVFGGGGGEYDGGHGGVTNGQAAALTYAREGAAVAVIDLDLAAARRTVSAIESEGGTGVALPADVTDGEQVAEAVRAATDALGPVDVLHNNVGVTVLGGPMELSYEQWRRAFALNVDGVFLACRHVLPAMLDRGRGAIVNVSSLAGLRHVGYPYPAYMAAKAAVNQLTVSLALTHAADGVRVNAVAPGFIDTPLVRQQLASQADSVDTLLAARHALSPTGRMGTPWDVANASLFLASAEAAYVNAVCLPVDGGLSMSCAG